MDKTEHLKIGSKAFILSKKTYSSEKAWEIRKIVITELRISEEKEIRYNSLIIA